MGWANCGQDSKGRQIGYAHPATCDHPGCEKEIDRGLAYACGGMHGDCTGWACEGYFCCDHLRPAFVEDEDVELFEELTDGAIHQLCPTCNAEVKAKLAEAVAS